MLIPTQDNDLFLPFDDVQYGLADADILNQEDYNYTLEIDGTGKLQIVNTGGTSASEGGMGSGNQDNKEKGELEHPMTGEKGGKPNEASESESGWDPIGENIDKETEKRKRDEE